jgi:archaellum component FlaC
VKAERIAFLQRSRERLALRRTTLAEAFRWELESKTDRVKAAKELLDDEEEDINRLTRSLAGHSELGAALRTLAEEIDSIDGRIAQIDAQLHAAQEETD